MSSRGTTLNRLFRSALRKTQLKIHARDDTKPTGGGKPVRAGPQAQRRAFDPARLAKRRRATRIRRCRGHVDRADRGADYFPRAGPLPPDILREYPTNWHDHRVLPSSSQFRSCSFLFLLGYFLSNIIRGSPHSFPDGSSTKFTIIPIGCRSIADFSVISRHSLHSRRQRCLRECGALTGIGG